LQTFLYAGFAAALLGSTVFFALPFAEASTAQNGNNVTIGLSTIVRGACSISAVADPQAANIDLSTTQSNLAIATVTESCNNNGYTVSVSSENGVTKGQPALVGSALNGSMNYTVVYGGAPVNFSGGQATAFDTSATLPLTRRQVGIGFVGNPNLPSDSYVDVLTFTIAGK
jgi:hypothetical protein